jgi:hypothetical protein
MVMALLAAAMLLRLTLGWHWSRQFAAMRDELRRSNQPVTLSDVVIDDVPDGQNAWLLYTRAAGALRTGPAVDSPRNSSLEYPSYPPYGAAWEKQAAASEAANAGVFPIARAARQLSRSQIRRGGPINFNNIVAGGFTPLRGLANLFADGATYQHLKGNDAEALERLRDGYRLGRALEADPTFVSQLVGWGVDALMMSTTQQIAPALTIRSASEPNANAASPDVVRAMITDLLDETQGRDALLRCVQVERTFQLDLYETASKSTWVIRPLATRSASHALAVSNTAIEAGQAPTRVDAERLLAEAGISSASDDDFKVSALPGVGDGSAMAPRYSRWFAMAIGGPGTFDRINEQYFRWSAERRVTTAILATRLYRVEKGRWPARLDDLVPAYLPAVPLDPFGQGKQPIGYVLKRNALPDGGDRPLFYFEAGEDEAAKSEAVIDTEPMFGWQDDRRDGRDGSPRQYRDAALWLPTTRRFDEEQKRAAEEERLLAEEEGVELNP